MRHMTPGMKGTGGDGRASTAVSSELVYLTGPAAVAAFARLKADRAALFA